MRTHALQLDDATIAYDVRAPQLAAEDRPALLLIGQPMTAEGFSALAPHFPDRPVVTYDPRGLGRSTRDDGRLDHSPTVQATDLHALIEALDSGPVDVFATSGGAVSALALVASHPDDVLTLVAHEPPLANTLPDADQAARAYDAARSAYAAAGRGAGMAAFIQMTSWQGPFTEAYFEQSPPAPGAFGMSGEDDGSRDDPILSDRSLPIVGYRPEADALRAAPTRIVIAAGEETGNAFTARTSRALADLLGLQVTVFPSHHGGFLGPDSGHPGQPEAFARALRSVLDADG